MSFLRVRNQLLDGSVKVCLHETAAEWAKPADQIVRLDMRFILQVNEVKHNFPSILQIQLLVRQWASELEARRAKLLLWELLEGLQGCHLNLGAQEVLG